MHEDPAGYITPSPEEAPKNDHVPDEQLAVRQWEGRYRWREMASHISSTKPIKTPPKAPFGTLGDEPDDESS